MQEERAHQGLLGWDVLGHGHEGMSRDAAQKHVIASGLEERTAIHTADHIRTQDELQGGSREDGRGHSGVSHTPDEQHGRGGHAEAFDIRRRRGEGGGHARHSADVRLHQRRVGQGLGGRARGWHGAGSVSGVYRRLLGRQGREPKLS